MTAWIRRDCDLSVSEHGTSAPVVSLPNRQQHLGSAPRWLVGPASLAYGIPLDGVVQVSDPAVLILRRPFPFPRHSPHRPRRICREAFTFFDHCRKRPAGAPHRCLCRRWPTPCTPNKLSLLSETLQRLTWWWRVFSLRDLGGRPAPSPSIRQPAFKLHQCRVGIEPYRCDNFTGKGEPHPRVRGRKLHGNLCLIRHFGQNLALPGKK